MAERPVIVVVDDEPDSLSEMLDDRRHEVPTAHS
jgi:hypothetical protein